MKYRVALIIVMVSSLVMGGATGAGAQLLLDQALTGAIGGGAELSAVARPPVATDVIIQRLTAQGYSNITAINSSQFSAKSPDGTPITLTIEPRTGQILSATLR